jgi:hypothetical protein
VGHARRTPTSSTTATTGTGPTCRHPKCLRSPTTALPTPPSWVKDIGGTTVVPADQLHQARHRPGRPQGRRSSRAASTCSAPPATIVTSPTATSRACPATTPPNWDGSQLLLPAERPRRLRHAHLRAEKRGRRRPPAVAGPRHHPSRAPASSPQAQYANDRFQDDLRPAGSERVRQDHLHRRRRRPPRARPERVLQLLDHVQSRAQPGRTSTAPTTAPRWPRNGAPACATPSPTAACPPPSATTAAARPVRSSISAPPRSPTSIPSPPPAPPRPPAPRPPPARATAAASPRCRASSTPATPEQRRLRTRTRGQPHPKALRVTANAARPRTYQSNVAGGLRRLLHRQGAGPTPDRRRHQRADRRADERIAAVNTAIPTTYPLTGCQRRRQRVEQPPEPSGPTSSSSARSSSPACRCFTANLFADYSFREGRLQGPEDRRRRQPPRPAGRSATAAATPIVNPAAPADRDRRSQPSAPLDPVYVRRLHHGHDRVRLQLQLASPRGFEP